MTGFFYCGSLGTAERTRELENDFLFRTGAFLKDTQWTPLIEQRKKSIGD